ncbi:hypothetical protein [Halomonas citrativorans]|uniref:hypothetical protein n=1 Tax=Halomonas citrativorans TaxID=2742612 RepID=UPI00111D7978|nr:hypothetical protein [Halomonas citrativorans]
MSKHSLLLQSYAALLVLNVDRRRIQATSTNLAALMGLSRQSVTLTQLLGTRLIQRLSGRRGFT